jgi:hypothetical protein
VAAVQVHRGALRDRVAKQGAANQRRDAHDHQGRAQHAEHEAVHLVLAVRVLEHLDHPHPGQRRGNASHRKPERDPAVNGLVLQVPPAARGLGDGAVEDVGADSGDRLDAEDQDQERGHQRAAAHAGHSDQQADAKAEDDDDWVHVLRVGIRAS